MEHAWKACIRLNVSRVRIPLSPPHKKKPLYGAFFYVAEREALIQTLGSKKSPGAIFHERSEPDKFIWNKFVQPFYG